MRNLALIAPAILAAAAAAQHPFPLPASAGDTTALEGTAPFVIPTRMTQTRLTDRNTLLPQGLPTSFVNWDMVALDPSARFVFIPCENFAQGAGVFRYDTVTGAFAVLMQGNGTGNSGRTANPAAWNPTNDEFTSMDPCTWTPWNSILVGEETTGGRLFEVRNPLAATGPYQVVWHSKIPAMAHEGMRFDRQGALYVIDEFNSGSIYKFVPLVPGDLSVGQTFVLSVDAYAADQDARPAENWNSTSNRLTTRFGPATWIPMTDASGNALTTADPFAFVTTTGGRTAADELLATPYGRPEDLDIATLAHGNEAIFVAITSENRVLSIELTGATTAIVREFANFDTINLATGADVNPLQNDPYTSPGAGTVFNNPDNIALDAWGSVYVIEDANPGDTWKCVDADRDGVAEAMGLFTTLGVAGSEPTGMIFDPVDPYRFIACVQHPSSGSDALWSFSTRPFAGSDQDLVLRSGVNAAPRTGPGESVKAARSGDNLVFAIDSPNGSFDYAPFALLLQPTVTPPFRFLPPLWISPLSPIVVVSGGFAGGFQHVLPPQGATYALRVPAGTLGLSVVAQGLAISNVGAIIATDAHEVIL